MLFFFFFFFFQAEDGKRDPLWSRGLGNVYKSQARATTVLSTPAENATATRPYPWRVASSESSFSSRAGGSVCDILGVGLVLCRSSEMVV